MTCPRSGCTTTPSPGTSRRSCGYCGSCGSAGARPSPKNTGRPAGGSWGHRDFSLLLCSLLRATGTPARLRCGFATYLADGWYEDHWVTEYLAPDGVRRLADAQIHSGYDVPFDPMDVPRDAFLVAGDVWQACRRGRVDPETCGLSSVEKLRGLWFVHGNVLRDLAALNGVELLPWDGWEPWLRMGTPLTEDALAAADAVAAARSPDDRQRLFADPRLTVPAEITSYTPYLGDRRVTLPVR
ncbi:hypothetical protein [Streptomyces massasporeus]|uniref:hypothetical protein n=1 Tax=Streptomyces massasporeus TaxID=67324 RepID=UPI0019933EF4|nr:hypothetical protein [Streptomyces massasporeus]GGV74334.1 hypothetical protein GCM10010228_36290 [Streptomyces massasporeus]